jgi:hypothetical protein
VGATRRLTTRQPRPGPALIQRVPIEFAVEGCTGWRYVVEEIIRAGLTPRLAEPAETAALRGKKRHAKTDKTDAAIDNQPQFTTYRQIACDTPGSSAG